MNEQQLRQLVRDAVSRHMGADASPHLPISKSPHLQGSTSHHPSAVLYAGLVNVSDACVIEPAVTCDHCGFCTSHGH